MDGDLAYTTERIDKNAKLDRRMQSLSTTQKRPITPPLISSLSHMSAYATTPETYAAWRFVELYDEHHSEEREQAMMARASEEVDLLFADIEKSQTLENVLQFLKQSYELRCFRQKCQSRILERYRCEQVCNADLEVRPGAYPCFGAEEEVRRRAEECRRKYAERDLAAAEIEKELHDYAENERILAGVEAILAERRAELPAVDDDDEESPDDGSLEGEDLEGPTEC